MSIAAFIAGARKGIRSSPTLSTTLPMGVGLSAPPTWVGPLLPTMPAGRIGTIGRSYYLPGEVVCCWNCHYIDKASAKLWDAVFIYLDGEYVLTARACGETCVEGWLAGHLVQVLTTLALSDGLPEARPAPDYHPWAGTIMRLAHIAYGGSGRARAPERVVDGLERHCVECGVLGRQPGGLRIIAEIYTDGGKEIRGWCGAECLIQWGEKHSKKEVKA